MDDEEEPLEEEEMIGCGLLRNPIFLLALKANMRRMLEKGFDSWYVFSRKEYPWKEWKRWKRTTWKQLTSELIVELSWSVIEGCFS